MKTLFVYKGRYPVRDAVTMEYLSAIAASQGYQTALVYDQDIFGITDNVFSSPFLNRIFSRDNRIIKNIMAKEAPLVVFLDGFNRRKWNKKIARETKRLKNKIITVLLSYVQSSSEEETYDYVLQGEPEFAFQIFLKDRLFNGRRGLYSFPELADQNSLPLPDKKIFAPYVNFQDSYLIYTSKGCPYACSYCEETIYKDISSHGYFRRRTPENVIRELEEARKNFNIKEIVYKDSVFALDKEWLEVYLGRYKKLINLPYKCFGRAEVFDEELALMLKESKCYCIEFGVQTFNEHLKKNVLNRIETTDTLLEAFSLCDKHALKYDVDHLFGIPGEEKEDHLQAAKVYLTLKHINRIKCHNLTFYREAKVYAYAPVAVKDNPDYRADFFSVVSGEKEMLKINVIFQKYFKVLPLFSKSVNLFLIKSNRWKLFKIFPSFLVIFFMLVLAVKNKDKRFKVYLKYYPLRLLRVILG